MGGELLIQLTQKVTGRRVQVCSTFSKISLTGRYILLKIAPKHVGLSVSWRESQAGSCTNRLGRFHEVSFSRSGDAAGHGPLIRWNAT